MTLAMAAVLVLAAGQAQEEFFQDFRGGAAMHPGLTLFGPDPESAAKQEKGGLRITLPAKREDPGAVGVAPRFRISGDFEITVGYEIVSADKPPGGMGAGVKLWGEIESPDAQAMTLAHLVPPDGDGRFAAMFSSQGGDGKRAFKNASRVSAAKKGRLRLVRTGAELSFLVAEGDSEAFEEIHRVAVGAGDVGAMRISVNTSDVPSAVSVRLADLRIRADRLPARSAAASAAAPSRGKGGLVAWGLVLVIAVGGGLAFWRLKRRRG